MKLALGAVALVAAINPTAFLLEALGMAAAKRANPELFVPARASESVAICLDEYRRIYG